jgi:hypothetical protein
MTLKDFFESHSYDKTGDWRNEPLTGYDPDDEDDEDLEKAPPGPPPREGLTWKEQTHRWIRPRERVEASLVSESEDYKKIEHNYETLKGIGPEALATFEDALKRSYVSRSIALANGHQHLINADDAATWGPTDQNYERLAQRQEEYEALWSKFKALITFLDEKGLLKPPANLGKNADDAAKHITDASVSRATHVGGGINVTEMIVLEDGTQAYFKPEFGENKNGFPIEGTLYQREVAAYQVAKFIGIESVPVTAVKNIGGMLGSAQKRVDNPGAFQYRKYSPDDEVKMRKQTEDAGFFDLVIGNMDRHPGNALMDGEHNLWLIDHGMSFPTTPDPFQLRSIFVHDLDISEGKEISKRHHEMLDKMLRADDFKNLLTDLFPEQPDVIKSVFRRVKRMKTTDRYNVDESGM